MNNSSQADEVLARLTAYESQLVEFARTLVATPSENPPGDERAVAAVAEAAMHQFGFTQLRTIAADSRRPNLIGEIGADGPTLILNGHLDTKPVGNRSDWEHRPIWCLYCQRTTPRPGGRRHEGLCRGDGLRRPCARRNRRAARKTHARSNRGRRERRLPGSTSRGRKDRRRRRAGRRELRPRNTVAIHSDAARGICAFTVCVKGTQLHSSLTSTLSSVNANVKMAYVLDRMAEAFRPSFEIASAYPKSAPLVNAGLTATGGVSWGLCPSESEFTVDVRTIPGMRREQFEHDLADFIASLEAEDPELELEIRWRPGVEWLAPATIDHSHPLVTAVQQSTAEVLGQPLETGITPGSTDARHWLGAGIPSLPAFGPGLWKLLTAPTSTSQLRRSFRPARCLR